MRNFSKNFRKTPFRPRWPGTFFARALQKNPLLKRCKTMQNNAKKAGKGPDMTTIDDGKELLEPEDLKPVLLMVTAANPDKRNPVRAKTHLTVLGGIRPQIGPCLYTSQTDSADHCIIGELASVMKWLVPGPDVLLAAFETARVYDWPVTEDSRIYLRSVQNAADLRDSDGELRPWSDPTIREAIFDTDMSSERNRVWREHYSD